MLATKNFWILLFHETNFSVGPDSAVKLHFTSKITFCPWIQFTDLHPACGFFAHNYILAMDPMHRITFCSCILHPELHSGHHFNVQNYILLMNSTHRITFWPKIQYAELHSWFKVQNYILDSMCRITFSIWIQCARFKASNYILLADQMCRMTQCLSYLRHYLKRISA